MRRKRKNTRNSDLKKFVIAFFLITILGCVGMIYELYSRVYQPNVVFTEISEKYINIPTGSDFFQVVTILSENGLLINTNSFEWLAKHLYILPISLKFRIVVH